MSDWKVQIHAIDMYGRAPGIDVASMIGARSTSVRHTLISMNASYLFMVNSPVIEQGAA